MIAQALVRASGFPQVATRFAGRPPMYFHKIHDPINCSFPTRYDAKASRLSVGEHSLHVALDDLGSDIFRVRLTGPPWPHQYSHVELPAPSPDGASRPGHALVALPSRATLRLGPRAELELRDADGARLLGSVPGESFGVCGSAWLFHFELPTDAQFYGMGEKGVGFERSGLRTKFWNTDVWADFPMSQVRHAATDPMYASVPWVIIKQVNRYVGLLLNAAGASYLRTPPAGRSPPDRHLWFGAPDGQPELFILVGPSLAELTEKLQRLVGVTPRPPLWALGHQQCRWGYKSQAELDALAQQFERHAIPNDGLWLDIDYMVGYRVFTVSDEHWPDLEGGLAALRARGFHVVPILDPGVKLETGYEVYDDGKRRRVFCLNPEGKPYVGYVWPGQTVFPDYSLERVRAWWAERVARFARRGFSGAWVDMNDPSTGATENADMLFDGGQRDHQSYHNQYGAGMAEATRAGFERARPDERAFILTRSAFIGTGRFAAVWTGDNCSNWYHLAKCIEVSLHLALSGIPFNGPDVPGFGDDPDAELAVAWYKVCFLFPFLRNHSQKSARHQEPWTFGKSSKIIRRYIRLRYKLLPYLYQLFIQQEQSGAAILRPLFHDFADTPELPLGEIADQFLIGPALLQAPVVTQGAEARRVVLPKATWFDARNGAWRRGHRMINVRQAVGETPLYIRAGSLIPMQVGERTNNQNDLTDIELHVFCPPGANAFLDYTFDDGHSLAYQRAQQSSVHFEAESQGDVVRMRVRADENGAGALKVRFVLHSPNRALVLELDGAGEQSTPLRDAKVHLTGEPLSVRVSRVVVIGG
jgi:alpha-glucosidase